MLRACGNVPKMTNHNRDHEDRSPLQSIENNTDVSPDVNNSGILEISLDKDSSVNNEGLLLTERKNIESSDTTSTTTVAKENVPKDDSFHNSMELLEQEQIDCFMMVPVENVELELVDIALNDLVGSNPISDEKGLDEVEYEESVDPSYIPTDERANEDEVAPRKKRKILKNKGEAYVSKTGKMKPKRELQPLIACRNKCREKLGEELRRDIFEEYWNLLDHDKRVRYVARHIEVKEKAVERKTKGEKRKHRQFTYVYTFFDNKECIVVCKNCFLKTLDETPKFIECAIKNKLQSPAGITCDDKRGRHIPANKSSEADLEVIRNHIKSFPAYESHYSRKQTKKKYLGCDLNLSIMYDLYVKFVNNPAQTKSRKIYSQEFKKLDLKFKKPALDTCTTCDTLNMTIKYSKNNEEREIINNKLILHQTAADKAYDEKRKDKERCKTDIHTKVICFDLQQVLQTPLLTSGDIFYKRQLSVYNLTIHDCQTGRSTHCMWHEAVAKRGANEISSCLFKYIATLPSETEHLVMYSDTCGGQNKNTIVISMLTFALQQHPTLKTIEHKFLVPGHTHLECDTDHAAIEKKSKTSPFAIHHPRDWYNLVRISGKKNKFQVEVMDQTQFLNFSSLMGRNGPLQKKKTDVNKNPFNFREIKWLKFEKQFGQVYYKNSLDEDVIFREMSFLKKNRDIPNNIPPAYDKPVPISALKKQNLLSMLPQIDQDAREFYQQLDTVEEMADNDPDLDRLTDEEF